MSAMLATNSSVKSEEFAQSGFLKQCDDRKGDIVVPAA
jgi:hypothetical protein